MTNNDNISGANIVSGSNIASGLIVVNRSFAIGVSGELDVYAKTDYGQIYIPAFDVVIVGSDGKIRWVEKRK